MPVIRAGDAGSSAQFAQLTVQSGANVAIQTDANGGVRLPTRIGFFDKAPSGKPSITGSRGSNAALQSLLNALNNMGLITNNTTT